MRTPLRALIQASPPSSVRPAPHSGVGWHRSLRTGPGPPSPRRRAGTGVRGPRRY